MKSKITYHEQTDMENTLKLREVLKTLPSFTSEFFRGISTTTSTSTRIKYAYDLRIFFQYLQKENPELAKIPMDQMSVDVLDQVTALDLEEYTEYLKAYIGSQESYTTNGEKGLKRKLSALRTFYSYYFKKELIETNPTLLIDMPKLHEKEIIRLEPNEVAELLDFIESCGDGLSNHQRAYYEKTKERDFAIITLLLGTGIRVSECVGLDIEDVDFKNNGIKVLRKGGNEMFVYFGDEVAEALKKYIEVRAGITPVAGHEHALFYSAQRKRINVKTVENLGKKYASQGTTTKKSHHTSFAVLTVLLCIRKQAIFILLRMFSAIRMSIRRRSIMLPWTMQGAVRLPQRYGCGSPCRSMRNKNISETKRGINRDYIPFVDSSFLWRRLLSCFF